MIQKFDLKLQFKQVTGNARAEYTCVYCGMRKQKLEEAYKGVKIDYKICHTEYVRKKMLAYAK